MRTFSFIKLNLRQKARQLAATVYKLTKKFPDEEKFGLIDKIKINQNFSNARWIVQITIKQINFLTHKHLNSSTIKYNIK